MKNKAILNLSKLVVCWFDFILVFCFETPSNTTKNSCKTWDKTHANNPCHTANADVLDKAMTDFSQCRSVDISCSLFPKENFKTLMNSLPFQNLGQSFCNHLACWRLNYVYSTLLNSLQDCVQPCTQVLGGSNASTICYQCDHIHVILVYQWDFHLWIYH